MSLDQAATQRLHDLVEAFAQTTQAVIDLASSCSAEDLAQPTDCPGWTVHDQISHVVGVEAWLGGHQDPRVEMPPYEHIRNDLGKRVEYAVEVRRARTGSEVVAELEQVLAQRLSALRSPDLRDASVIAGPFGQDRAATVLMMRTFDVWAHEQDIRTALGRPGDLDSRAAAVFVSTAMLQLPKLLAMGAALGAGQSVVIEVTGPTVARQGFGVEKDEQGRLRGRAISVADLAPEPTATISLSTEAFTRRAAGRRSAGDTAYGVVGDEAVAGRVMEALVVTH